MYRTLVILAFLLAVAGTATQAQELASRYQKQHLQKTEQMLLQGLESGSADIQITTTQTIRDLQMEYPDESFSTLVNPLITLLKNERANVTARILAALALDGLHSDPGDMAVSEVMRYTENTTVKELCTALRAKSLR
jgi:hypothetical protein